MATKKRTSKKPQSVLPELLNRAINETLESLTRPIPPGEDGEVARGYRRALLRDRDRLESVILWRWRVLIEEDDPHHQEAETRFWAAVREGYDRCNAELVEVGFNPPGDDIQRWLRLAKVVETDPEFTNLGELTEEALTWAERESIRERIRQRVHADVESSKDARENLPAVTAEEMTILEALQEEHPMTVGQESLVGVTRLSDKCVRGYLKQLEEESKLVHRPKGPRKGYGLTPLAEALLKGRQSTG